jgi:SNF2-related domain
MEVIDNVSRFLGDDLKRSITPNSKVAVAAASFSIYAFEALKQELEGIDSLQFIFTTPTFVPGEVTDRARREVREFHIPQPSKEKSFFGTDFELRLKNKLTQRAIAKECADWIRRKAQFRSNRSGAPMQQFACVQSSEQNAVYMPLHGFTAVDLGYQQGNAVSNFINRMDEPTATRSFIELFDQIWKNVENVSDVTEIICDHIASVYQENSPQRIYFLMLYSIFSEFLEDISADVLPNERTGYQDSVIWQKLYHFQKDAATGIINKLETYNGCILADSVGLGKTFTALAVVKYYELRNKSVLVLCPKKLADNWLTYKGNLKNNPLLKDRLCFDVLCHTDLLRDRGESLGLKLNRVNWSNYDLVVIDESHNFRNDDAFKDRETRYQYLMNKVIKQGVRTKVLMLSATPVNNRFNDLKNQLALAYEGEPETLSSKLKATRNVDQIFRRAQAAFNTWSKLPAEERTPQAILASLDFDFFELLDSVTIARSRRHITTFYDTKEIGEFPTRRKPLAARRMSMTATYAESTAVTMLTHAAIQNTGIHVVTTSNR